MMTNKDPLSLKIFLGYLQTSEIKMLLSQSRLWKEEKLFEKRSLAEVQFQSRDYIGKFIESSVTYGQLKEKTVWLNDQLQTYCPKLRIEKQTLYLFPQLFLS